MAQERLSMRKTREILRLKWECKLPHRAVARSCDVGTGSVTDCLQRAIRAGLSWPLPEGLGDDELERRLFPEPDGPAGDRTAPRALPDWTASNATAAGSPDACEITVTLLRWPQTISCSRAAARKVSPAASRTDWS